MVEQPMTPKDWFDQFGPNPAMDGHTQWCARHWGPCPELHANGIGASLEVMKIFTDEMLVANGISPRNAAKANAKLEETGLLCCWLGDDRMYEIWGRFPPASGSN